MGKSNLALIGLNKDGAAEKLKELQGAPESMEKCYDAFIEFYTAYNDLMEFAYTLEGNLSEYSADRKDKVDKVLAASDKLNVLLPEPSNKWIINYINSEKNFANLTGKYKAEGFYTLDIEGINVKYLGDYDEVFARGVMVNKDNNLVLYIDELDRAISLEVTEVSFPEYFIVKDDSQKTYKYELIKE